MAAKKKDEKSDSPYETSEEDKKELQRIIEKFKTPPQIPNAAPRAKQEVLSREYKEYKEGEFLDKQMSFYEKACKSSEQLGIKPGNKKQIELEKAIDFSGVKVTPTGAASFGALCAILTLLPALTMIFLLNIAVLLKLFL